MRELLAWFVPAADEVSRLQRSDDAESRFFQGFAEQGHYAGRTEPSTTRQGIYAIAPSGRLLASLNTRSGTAVADMLTQALVVWQLLPPDERGLSAAQRDALGAVPRWRQRYPEDGLVLDLVSRDLDPPPPQASDWQAHAFNLDHAWFTAAEARRLVPAEPRPGVPPADIPAELVERLVRFHLLDNVRGQTSSFPADSVLQAELTTEVESRDGDVVQVLLRGVTLCETRGEWPVHGFGEPSPQRRGMRTALRGHGTYDLARQRFVAFELVALGERWGGTQFNARGAELDPSAIGFVFQLAPADGPRVAPAFIYRYGWPAPR